MILACLDLEQRRLPPWWRRYRASTEDHGVGNVSRRFALAWAREQCAAGHTAVVVRERRDGSVALIATYPSGTPARAAHGDDRI